MTSELPEQLRELADSLDCCQWNHPITGVRTCVEAAQDIERLRGELFECRQLLSTAEDAWECGAWNSLIGMQQLYLTRSWYEAARAAGQGRQP